MRKFMIIIDQKLVTNLTREARKSNRLRKNHNFHADYADPVNRMLNAFEPGTYVRPHKHETPDKSEVFIVLTGKAVAVQFDETGSILEQAVLDHKSGVFGVEIPPRVWHTILSLASGTVLYEVKQGPYAPLEDKNFAVWAPEEGSPEAAAYVGSVLRALGLRLETEGEADAL